MPPVEIVTGALPELEDALADAVASARHLDPLGPVTVLVDNVLLRPYLSRALALRGVPLINAQFLRPNELAERLAGPNDDKPRLTPNAERLLTREIAREAHGYFAGIAGREGFAEALARLFRELELGGFTPVSFARAVEAAADGRLVDAAKLRDLAQLFGWYAGRRSALAAPADFYGSAGIASFEGPLLVYGVWSPTELQARLIEGIARVAAVTVFLAATGGAVDEAHAAFRNRLLAGGATERRLDRSADACAAVNVARALFGAPSGPLDVQDAVSLASAPDTVREVWEAARACLRWAEDGVRFHDMAVVYRNRERYRALVDEIFTEAGIETYLHDGRLLASHPLGRRLLALLDLAADPAFARAKVMEFLTETRLSRETVAKYGRVRPSEWETYTREAGVVDDAEQWDQRLARLAGEKRETSKMEGFEWQAGVADRIDVLRQFAADLRAALTSRPAEGTWDEHLSWLAGLAKGYATGTEPIVEALQDLRTLDVVARRVTFDVFCRAVRDDLESRDASLVLGEPVRRFGKRGVAVIDATSLRHLQFRAVYMLGAAERAWPPPARPDPLVLEHERHAINIAGVGALPLRTEPDSEALTFWLGVQAARERLVVSYARADAGGSGKHLPSYIFRGVAEAVEGHPLKHDEIDAAACVRRYSASRLVSDELGESLSRAEYDRGLVRSENAAAVSAIERLSPEFGRAIDARHARWGSALTAFDGVMTTAEGTALALRQSQFNAGDPVSPTRLETYATCPYRYFLRHGLRIEPVDEPEAIERIDALERGSLIHAILERFLRAVGRDDPPSSARREAHLERLLAIAREEGADRERRGVTGRPLVWAMDQKQIGEDLVRWYDREVIGAGDGLRPGAFEVSFGPVRYGIGTSDTTISSDEPLVLRAGARELRLQGRIDRVDWDDERRRFRVIDYKTGSPRDKAAFDHGRALQLPVYLHAAARLLDMSPEDGEAQYFYVSSRGGFKRRKVTGQELAERAADGERVIETIADGVDAGMFAPNPGKDRFNCKWCDYADVCDARVDTIMRRKAGDPRAAAYRALEEIS
jgi:ATP-dependent helicase/nuclease subunit B